MKLLLMLVLLCAGAVLALIVFQEEIERYGWMEQWAHDGEVFRARLEGGGLTCAVPELRDWAGRAGFAPCAEVSGFIEGGSGDRRGELIEGALFHLAGNFVVALSALGVLLSLLLSVVAMPALTAAVRRKLFGLRLRWIFRKREYRSKGETLLKVPRRRGGRAGDLVVDVHRFHSRHRDVCLELLRALAYYGGREYLTRKEHSEGTLEWNVRLIYGAGMRQARAAGWPLRVQGLAAICLLAQELGKMGAFYKIGTRTTWGYAGPQHQSKSAGVLRSMRSFQSLPRRERDLIVRLVASHHEDLLPDGVHGAVRMLRDVLRRSEHLRGKLTEAAVAA